MLKAKAMMVIQVEELLEYERSVSYFSADGELLFKKVSAKVDISGEYKSRWHPVNIYEQVKELCSEKGISISCLEKEVGAGNATIDKWKTSSPRVDSLKKVADYFGLKVDDFL